MTPRDLENAVPKLARNEIFTFVARICMMVSIPLAVGFGSRLISQIDTLQAAQIEQNVSIKVMSATVRDRLDSNISQLSDHELRLRSLERNHQN